MEFLTNNLNLIINILLVLGFIGYVVYVYKTKGKEAAMEIVKAKILELMLIAEKSFNKNQGKRKMDLVVQEYIESLPTLIQDGVDVELTQEEVRAELQKFYDEIKWQFEK